MSEQDYTVVGYYRDNGQSFMTAVKAASPDEAAGAARDSIESEYSREQFSPLVVLKGDLLSREVRFSRAAVNGGDHLPVRPGTAAAHAMTEAERQSLSEVLEYMGDEKKHYEECLEAGEGVEKHVYTHVQVLEAYLERQTPAASGAARPVN